MMASHDHFVTQIAIEFNQISTDRKNVSLKMPWARVQKSNGTDLLKRHFSLCDWLLQLYSHGRLETQEAIRSSLFRPSYFHSCFISITNI